MINRAFFFIFIALLSLGVIADSQVAETLNQQIEPHSSDMQERTEKALLHALQFKSESESGVDMTSEGIDPLKKLKPHVECNKFIDPTTQASCFKAWQAYFEHFQQRLEHRQKVFVWQHKSTYIILFVVLALVAAGLIFAAIQFRISMREGQSGSLGESQLELSTSGIKVNSSVLGVIILTISLAFFYLYLLYVYPITAVA